MAIESKPPASITMKLASFIVALFWYLGFVGMAFLAAIVIAGFVFDIHVKYVQLPVEISFDQKMIEAGGQPIGTLGSAVIAGFQNPRVLAKDLPAIDYMLIIPILLLIGFQWIMYQLKRFLRTVRKGRPFDRDNPRRLRNIGYAITAAGPVYGISNLIYGRIYLYYLDIPDAMIEAPMNVHPFVIFCGLVVLVIAQVFDVGVKMREDQDLTV